MLRQSFRIVEFDTKNIYIKIYFCTCTQTQRNGFPFLSKTIRLHRQFPFIYKPNGNLFSYKPNGNQISYNPNGNPLSYKPNRNQLIDKPNGNQLGYKPNGNLLG